MKWSEHRCFLNFITKSLHCSFEDGALVSDNWIIAIKEWQQLPPLSLSHTASQPASQPSHCNEHEFRFHGRGSYKNVPYSQWSETCVSFQFYRRSFCLCVVFIDSIVLLVRANSFIEIKRETKKNSISILRSLARVYSHICFVRSIFLRISFFLPLKFVFAVVVLFIRFVEIWWRHTK